MKKLLFFSLIALIITSCTQHLIPVGNQVAKSLIFQLDSSSHILFESIKASDDKRFVTFQPQYIDLDSQINAILSLDSSRTNNKLVLVLANDIKKLITKYESTHASLQILNNVQADVNEKELHARITSLENAETNFN